jgi:hypothetical protein
MNGEKKSFDMGTSVSVVRNRLAQNIPGYHSVFVANNEHELTDYNKLKNDGIYYSVHSDLNMQTRMQTDYLDLDKVTELLRVSPTLINTMMPNEPSGPEHSILFYLCSKYYNNKSDIMNNQGKIIDIFLTKIAYINTGIRNAVIEKLKYKHNMFDLAYTRHNNKERKSAETRRSMSSINESMAILDTWIDGLSKNIIITNNNYFEYE